MTQLEALAGQEAKVRSALADWQKAGVYWRKMCRRSAAYEIRILRYMRMIHRGIMQ